MSVNDVIATFAQPFTVYRRGTGFVRKGRYTKGPLTAIPFTEVVWTAKGAELLEMPESMRTSETIAIVSKTEIKGLVEGTQQDPDIIAYDGKFFQVHHVAHWVYGGFYKAMAARISQSSVAALAYFGVGAAGSVTAAFILALSKTLLTGKDTYFEATTTTGQRLFLALPASIGTPTFKVDDAASTWASMAVSVGGVTYNLFESPTVSAGAHTVDTE